MTASDIPLTTGQADQGGTEFTAEAAVWNLDKLLNDKSPQYDPKQAGQGRTRIPAIASYKAVNQTTLEITTCSRCR